MRKIAFRVWDSNSGRMFVPTWEEIGGIVEYPNLNSHFHLMQYTGLKDRNGKEIYEGDIIKHDGGVEEVKWYGARQVSDEYSRWIDIGYLFDASDIESIEVIGNVYENPELIK